jgi:serine phosphatase RsbU (regulator of sigma subunit)
LKQPGRLVDFFDTYTKDLKAEDLQRLFTRDTREAYHFFTRHVDWRQLDALPKRQRWPKKARLLFFAFTMRLSPARRVVYALALFFAAIGFLDLMSVRSEGAFPDGMGSMVVAFILLNLLVLLEVADRLSLKNDLEIAREIQQAMLPGGMYAAAGVETLGMSRPANTVGGDFYDVIPLGDGRVVIAVGDVSGKGSPAALLMALLLAMMRTLVDEQLDPATLVARLNLQVIRHAPGTRFITLFYGVYEPMTGELTYVNAGHMPPLILRRGDRFERLTDGGIALGMFAGSPYTAGRALLARDELLVVYSDGITEAENAAGQPFDEQGLEAALQAYQGRELSVINAGVVRAVERHTGDVRLADDLTILLLRATAPPLPGV